MTAPYDPNVSAYVAEAVERCRLPIRGEFVMFDYGHGVTGSFYRFTARTVRGLVVATEPYESEATAAYLALVASLQSARGG